jgi:hypothetical protein
MIQSETNMSRFSRSNVARNLSRWVAIVALLAGTVGIVVAIGWPERLAVGYALVAGALALSICLPLAGPFKLSSTRPVDEFDRMIQLRAWLAACASTSFAAIFGMMMLLALGLMGHWGSMTLLFALGTLLTYLMVMLAAVPTLVIAGSAPADDED